MARLTGRKILITGGASGIGRATAVLCAREGASVASSDRSSTATEAPSLAHSTAVARPMPEAPPVIRIFRPVNRAILLSCSVGQRNIEQFALDTKLQIARVASCEQKAG